MVLGDEGYGTALELLTEAAVNGGLLTGETIQQYRKALSSGEVGEHPSIPELLYILEHDGYLESSRRRLPLCLRAARGLVAHTAPRVFHSNRATVG